MVNLIAAVRLVPATIADPEFTIVTSVITQVLVKSPEQIGVPEFTPATVLNSIFPGWPPPLREIYAGVMVPVIPSSIWIILLLSTDRLPVTTSAYIQVRLLYLQSICKEKGECISLPTEISPRLISRLLPPSEKLTLHGGVTKMAVIGINLAYDACSAPE